MNTSRWHVVLDVGSALLLALSIYTALWRWLPREAPDLPVEPAPPAYEVVPIGVAFRAGGKVRPGRVAAPSPEVTHTELKPETSLKGCCCGEDEYRVDGFYPS